MASKRSATYVSTLVYMDEPLLVHLKSQKAHLLALAVREDDPNKAPYVATTVSTKDFESYMEGHVDLRYVFTYPTGRSTYTFDMMEMKDNKISMTPFEGKLPEAYLPAPRFFSTSHTHDLAEAITPLGVERLDVDGEWDMPDFGDFYSRYSDVYYFLAATHAFADSNRSELSRKHIKQAFMSKPFKGGFSYVHLYSALPAGIGRQERLRMDKIKYESPGYVLVHGDGETFAETEALVRAFIDNRGELHDLYNQLHEFLSKNKYLSMPGNQFLPSDPAAAYIGARATEIADKLKLPNLEVVRDLVEDNALVFAKIVLSLYRRLKGTAEFFAQGRMNFTDRVT